MTPRSAALAPADRSNLPTGGDVGDSKSFWRSFWKIAEVTAIVSFPVLSLVAGFFISKVLDHEKQIAVMQVSYFTKDEAESRENGLKTSIDALKQTINDLRVEIVKVTNREPNGR